MKRNVIIIAIGAVLTLAGALFLYSKAGCGDKDCCMPESAATK
jgi:hypothetical protein